MLNSEYSSNKEAFDLIIEKYLNGEKPFSFSAISAFIKSGPRGFFEYIMFKKQTEGMVEGTIFHEYCLEPHKIKDKYFVFDDSGKVSELIEDGSKSPRSTKKYKEWKADVLALYSDKTEISKELHDTFLSMSEYLRVNESTRNIFNKIKHFEETKYFKYKGFNFVAKIDAIADDFTMDLKKCANANFRKLRWEIQDLNYTLQGLIYSKASMKTTHKIVFIDKDHKTVVTELLQSTLEQAENDLDRYLDFFMNCCEEDAWNQGLNYFEGNKPIMI